MEAAGLRPMDLDTIILATCTPDHPIPGAAPVVQHKLGAKKAAAFDLNAACSGWLYGLHVADGLIQSGKAKNILLVGAEFLTRFTDYTDRGDLRPLRGRRGRDRSQGHEGRPRRPLHVDPLATGRERRSSRCPAGAPPSRRTVPRRSTRRLMYIQMKGGETFKVAIRSMVEVCKEVLTESGFTTADVSWLLPHQANERILTATAERLQIPARARA